MARKRYNVNLDPEVVGRVKAQLGDTSFSRFTERALEAALPRQEIPPTVEQRRAKGIYLAEDIAADLRAQPAPQAGRRCELDCGRPVPTSPKVSRCSCGGRLVS